MKGYKVREELLPFVENILKEKVIPYRLETKEEPTIIAPVSGVMFHAVIEEAMCLYQQGTSKIPVLPYRIAVTEKRKKYGNVFRVLKKDNKRFHDAF